MLFRSAHRVVPLPLQLSPGEGGMHLAMALPAAVRDRDVVALARTRGLAPRALSSHHVGDGPALNGLVLGYANVAAEEAPRHVRSLAAAVRQIAR